VFKRERGRERPVTGNNHQCVAIGDVRGELVRPLFT
jgi:hypothetical protein